MHGKRAISSHGKDLLIVDRGRVYLYQERNGRYLRLKNVLGGSLLHQVQYRNILSLIVNCSAQLGTPLALPACHTEMDDHYKNFENLNSNFKN